MRPSSPGLVSIDETDKGSAKSHRTGAQLTPDLTIFPSDFPVEKWEPKSEKSVGQGYLFFENQLGDNSECHCLEARQRPLPPTRLAAPALAGR